MSKARTLVTLVLGKVSKGVSSYSKVGEHGLMSCCDLGNDMQAHAAAADRLAAKIQAAADAGDLDAWAAYALLWAEEVKEMYDASMEYSTRCGGKSLEEWCNLNR